MYKTRHFKLEELVDPQTMQAHGQRAWELLDERALITLDQLRDAFGFCVVNDWHIGGDFKLSGFRPPDCPIGARFSQHKYGRGFDCKFKDIKADAARNYILANEDEFPHLTTLERNVSWLHFDVRNHDKRTIWLVDG